MATLRGAVLMPLYSRAEVFAEARLILKKLGGAMSNFIKHTCYLHLCMAVSCVALAQDLATEPEREEDDEPNQQAC